MQGKTVYAPGAVPVSHGGLEGLALPPAEADGDPTITPRTLSAGAGTDPRGAGGGPRTLTLTVKEGTERLVGLVIETQRLGSNQQLVRV